MAFLGHVMNKDVIVVDPKKTEVIVGWKRPTSAMEICSLLGLTRYYRRFIKSL